MCGETAWTPDYTSPEQIRGRPVTVRTDVYSLGLILYELITGARAQSTDASSPLAMDRSICEVEPPPPSHQAAVRGDRALAKRLRGDLDTIVQTAIQKEPERRYESAAAFSEDLGRYLDGHPIVARPSTFTYRAGKLLRRHRAVAAATLLLAVSIVAGLVATVYQARRAERRFQQVRSLANAFVFDVHDRIEPLPGSTEARKMIVQTALTYLESLRSDIGNDQGLALELASAYEKIGNVQGNPLFRNLGDTSGALVSLTRAADLLRPLAEDGDLARPPAVVVRPVADRNGDARERRPPGRRCPLRRRETDGRERRDGEPQRSRGARSRRRHSLGAEPIRVRAAPLPDRRDVEPAGDGDRAASGRSRSVEPSTRTTWRPRTTRSERRGSGRAGSPRPRTAFGQPSPSASVWFTPSRTTRTSSAIS